MITPFVATFNGTDDITTPTGVALATDVYGGVFNYFHGIANDTLDAQFLLEGQSWSVSVLQLSANRKEDAKVDATITDGTGNDRSIELMQFFSGRDISLSLSKTTVGNIRGFVETFDFNLGPSSIGSIDIRGENHSVDLDGGDIGRLWLRGSSSVDVDGTIGSLNLGGGVSDKVIIRDGSEVGYLREFQNDIELILRGAAKANAVETIQSDTKFELLGTSKIKSLDVSKGTVNLIASSNAELGTVDIGSATTLFKLARSASVESLSQKGGQLTLRLSDSTDLRAADLGDVKTTAILGKNAKIGSFDLTGANAALNLNGASHIGDIRLEDGIFSIKGTGTVGSLTVYGSKLTTDIKGGAISVGIFSNGTKHTHNLKFGGVEALTITDAVDDSSDNQTAHITLSKDSGSIRLGNGHDKVTLGDIQVTSIATRSGNDTINHGGGSVETLRLGAGNDKVFLSAMSNNESVAVFASSGTDLINFSGISKGVRFSLDAAGGLQKLASTGVGWLSETGVENLTGTAKKDHLTGDFAANYLRGGKGQDTLNGGSGNDRLDGGAGNDRLTGGFSKDVFVFSGKSGRDKITDFAQSFDQIQLKSQSNFKSLSFQDKGNALRITHDNGTIDLLGQAGLALTADDFIL